MIRDHGGREISHGPRGGDVGEILIFNKRSIRISGQTLNSE